MQPHTQSCDKRDGSCSCKAGFWGERCQAGESRHGVWGGGRQGLLTPPTPLSRPAECEPGYFGPGCRQACTCPVGVACDSVSGECGKRCPAGFQGEDCGQGEWPAPGAPGSLIVGCRLPAWLEGGLQKGCTAVTIGPLSLSPGAALLPVLP